MGRGLGIRERVWRWCEYKGVNELLTWILSPLTAKRPIYDLGCKQSAVYTIDPGCGKAFSVWCDMSNGGDCMDCVAGRDDAMGW